MRLPPLVLSQRSWPKRSQRGAELLGRGRARAGRYFGAVGGAGALLSGYIKAAEVVTYEDLGTETIRRVTVEDFPVIVVDDTHGNDLYEQGMKQYARPTGSS
jgi:fumarate hydratase subunit beta